MPKRFSAKTVVVQSENEDYLYIKVGEYLNHIYFRKVSGNEEDDEANLFDTYEVSKNNYKYWIEYTTFEQACEIGTFFSEHTLWTQAGQGVGGIVSSKGDWYNDIMHKHSFKKRYEQMYSKQINAIKDRKEPKQDFLPDSDEELLITN